MSDILVYVWGAGAIAVFICSLAALLGVASFFSALCGDWVLGVSTKMTGKDIAIAFGISIVLSLFWPIALIYAIIWIVALVLSVLIK